MEYPQPQQNPQDQARKYWFFGSKLNTVLLLVLIVLMILALRIMMQDQGKYFPQIKNLPEKNEQTISFLKERIKGRETSFIITECLTKNNATIYISNFKGEGVGPSMYDAQGTFIAGYSSYPSFENRINNMKYEMFTKKIQTESCEVVFDKPYREGITIDAYNLLQNN